MVQNHLSPVVVDSGRQQKFCFLLINLLDFKSLSEEMKITKQALQFFIPSILSFYLYLIKILILDPIMYNILDQRKMLSRFSPVRPSFVIIRFNTELRFAAGSSSSKMSYTGERFPPYSISSRYSIAPYNYFSRYSKF